MILEDFHVHTTWCDGRDTAEAVVLRAVRMGVTRLGFSGHAHTPCDESYCMTPEGTKAYRREIAALKSRFAGQIEIFCGIEADMFSDADARDFDYAIGSVHYLKTDDGYVPVDESPRALLRAARERFGGDMLALAEAYYRQESRVIDITGADLIGHFDLISKFNEGGALFDEESPRYLDAAFAAIDALLETGVPFEVNTGAVSRGYRGRPYPAPPLLKRVAEKGGSVVLSSDSHSAATLCARFDEADRLCRSVGLTPTPLRVKRGN